MPTEQEIKKDVVQTAVTKLLDEHKVPARQLLTALQQVAARVKSHEQDIATHRDLIGKHEAQITQHAEHMDAHTRQLEEWDQIAEHLLSVEHLKGKDGSSVDFEKVVQEALNRIKVPSAPTAQEVAVVLLPLIEKAEDGKDAEVDHDAIVASVIKKMQEEKVIDVSHLRNSESFLFKTSQKNMEVKFEELMKGASPSSTGGSSTPLIPSGLVNAVNATYGVISQPSSVVSDGITYYETHGYTYSAPNIILDVPPSQYIRYYTA